MENDKLKFEEEPTKPAKKETDKKKKLGVTEITDEERKAGLSQAMGEKTLMRKTIVWLRRVKRNLDFVVLLLLVICAILAGGFFFKGQVPAGLVSTIVLVILGVASYFMPKGAYSQAVIDKLNRTIYGDDYIDKRK